MLEGIIIAILVALGGAGWVSYFTKPQAVTKYEIQNQTSIQNQGQATIVDQGTVRGVEYRITNIADPGEFLSGMDDWQRREVEIAGVPGKWIIIYPRPAPINRTNFSSFTNRTNY